MTTDAEELGARIIVTTKAVEPTGSTAHDSGTDGHGLDISHRGWASV